MCVFYSKGFCKYGPNCSFAHSKLDQEYNSGGGWAKWDFLDEDNNY